MIWLPFHPRKRLPYGKRSRATGRFPLEMEWMMRLLVVEDDPGASRFLGQGLTEEGHEVATASDGNTGLAMALEGGFDVILLDVMLPGIDGLEVAKQLRAEGHDTPVLMLTARDSTGDAVKGLDAGADDYLAKPFDFEELLARVRALGRRASGGGLPDVLRIADLELNRIRRTVVRNGRRIHLAPREFRLLEHFMLHPEQPQSRDVLLSRVWDMDMDPGTNVVDANISTLRRKLEDAEGQRLIVTVRGVGYAISAGNPDG